MISHSHKFIFVHVYKVAGTSIRAALSPYVYNPQKLIQNRVLRRLGMKNALFCRYNALHQLNGHATAKEMKETLPSSVFNNYFKFSFVRNPWDWQVSLYKFGLTYETHHQRDLISSFGSFDEYLEWRINEDKHLQKDFLADESGNLLVDYVGKIENINQDFSFICEKIGIQAELPHLNKSPHDHYTSYYNPHTISMVAEAFAEDIECFDYRFGE